MYRKPKHTHYDPIPEDDELDFVGTLADRFTTHPQRRQHAYRLPEVHVNDSRHRQKAGAGSATGIATDEEINRVIAVMYFLAWTRKALKNYSNDIRKLYEVPLSEKCFGPTSKDTATDDGCSLEDSRAAAKAVAAKLEAGLKVPVINSDLPKLQKRLAALVKGSDERNSTEAGVIRHTVTPIEVACLFRLRTLIKMSGSWLKKTVETEQWMEKQRKAIAQHATVIAPALEHAIIAFNAVCVLGEIYGLEPIDRSGVKKDFAKYLGEYDRPRLEVYDKPLVPTKDTLEWVPDLTAKLNAHRTLMHIIGSSTLTIFQIMLKALPPELLETTSKAIRSVAARLPPSFSLAPSLQLCPFASAMVAEAPPNSVRLSFGDGDGGDLGRSNSATKTNRDREDRTPSLSTEKPRSKKTEEKTEVSKVLVTPEGSRDKTQVTAEGSARTMQTPDGSAEKKASASGAKKKGTPTTEASGRDAEKAVVSDKKTNAAKPISPTMDTYEEVPAEKTQSIEDVAQSPAPKTAINKSDERSPPTARGASR